MVAITIWDRFSITPEYCESAISLIKPSSTLLVALSSRPLENFVLKDKDFSYSGTLVHGLQKKFVVSPTIQLNKSFGPHHSLEDNVAGLEALARLNVADVIAVQVVGLSGRGGEEGCGKGL